MINNPEIQEITGDLRKVLSFHGLSWDLRHDNTLPDACLSLALPSGKRLLIVCRAVISRPVVDKYCSLFASEMKTGSELLFATTSFTQSFVDSCSVQGIHFFSRHGACRITLPGIITYIVKIQNKSKTEIRNSGGTPFVGKGAMLPRIFFSQPQRVWTLRELSNMSGMTRAYASIIIHRMLDNGYVRQEDNGYVLVNPAKMLDDWVAVYHFNRYVRRQMFAASFDTLRRGLNLVAESLSGQNIRFGFMGPSGAYLRAPYMESGIVMAYTEQIPDEVPNLFPVESDGNVILYIPQNSGFIFGGHEVDGLPVVSDVQLYLDLKRMPGRNEDQADYLRDTKLNWR